MICGLHYSFYVSARVNIWYEWYCLLSSFVFIYFVQVLVHYQEHKKPCVVRCKTLLEFIEELKVVSGAVNSKESQRIFIQRQDETWCEKVDIESLDEVMNRDKLFLICSTITNTSQTDEKVWYQGGPPLTYIPMSILDTERA